MIILLARGRKRGALILALVSVGLLLLFSLSPFADALIRPLEAAYPPFEGAPAAKEIVVLGGGYRDQAPEYGGKAALGSESLARAAYGAELAQRLDLPLIFTGGNPARPAAIESEAEAAARFWGALGIEADRISLETQSRDTSENATLSKALVGSGPVVLVTSAWHMPRSVLAFKRAGIEVIAAPTAYRADRRGYYFLDFLPDAGALQTSAIALHEYIGLAWYRLRPSSY